MQAEPLGFGGPLHDIITTHVHSLGLLHNLIIHKATTKLAKHTYQGRLLCFAGWLSECTASHAAQNNTLWSNVEYFHHRVCIFLLCGVKFTYT